MQGPERYHGVVCAMRDAGLFPLDENFLWFSSFQRYQLVELQDESVLQNFLRQQLGGCTAVVCYNDEIAFHLIRTLLRMGKRVPEELLQHLRPRQHHLRRTRAARHGPRGSRKSSQPDPPPALPERPPAVDAVRPAERITE